MNSKYILSASGSLCTIEVRLYVFIYYIENRSYVNIYILRHSLMFTVGPTHVHVYSPLMHMYLHLTPLYMILLSILITVQCIYMDKWINTNYLQVVVKIIF